MKIEKNHKLENSEVYKRIDNLLVQLQKEHSNEITESKKTWNNNKTEMDFSITIKGNKVLGKIYLYDKRFSIEIKLPFLASFFSGKIESMIIEKLDKLLD